MLGLTLWVRAFFARGEGPRARTGRARGRSPRRGRRAFQRSGDESRRKTSHPPMPRPDFERPPPAPRLAFLGPKGEAPVGLNAVRVDFTVFFGRVREIGPEASLLLLALHALRLREPGGTVSLEALSWMLVSRPGEVLSWLERLVLARHVVYERLAAGDLVVELVAEPAGLGPWPWDGSPGPPRELPTFYFTQVLPRARRTAFLLYLALLAREERNDARSRVGDEDLRRLVGARSRLRVRHELRRLRRLGLVRLTRSGRGLIVCDPPPLSARSRSYLQLLQWGYRPLPWGRIAFASIAIALAMLILGYLVTHPRDVLLRPPLRDDERPDAQGLAGLLPVA